MTGVLERVETAEWGDTRIPAATWSKVYVCPLTGCWLAAYALDRDGYVRARVHGRRGLLHRIFYTVLTGPIPDGLQIDHLCRTRCCVNPQHLEPVTGRVNLLRGNTFQAANVAKTHCPQGHPYDATNTMLVGPKKSNRACRECYRIAWRKRYGMVKI